MTKSKKGPSGGYEVRAVAGPASVSEAINKKSKTTIRGGDIKLPKEQVKPPSFPGQGHSIRNPPPGGAGPRVSPRPKPKRAQVKSKIPRRGGRKLDGDPLGRNKVADEHDELLYVLQSSAADYERNPEHQQFQFAINESMRDAEAQKQQNKANAQALTRYNARKERLEHEIRLNEKNLNDLHSNNTHIQYRRDALAIELAQLQQQSQQISNEWKKLDAACNEKREIESVIQLLRREQHSNASESAILTSQPLVASQNEVNRILSAQSLITSQIEDAGRRLRAVEEECIKLESVKHAYREIDARMFSIGKENTRLEGELLSQDAIDQRTKNIQRIIRESQKALVNLRRD